MPQGCSRPVRTVVVCHPVALGTEAVGSTAWVVVVRLVRVSIVVKRRAVGSFVMVDMGVPCYVMLGWVWADLMEQGMCRRVGYGDIIAWRRGAWRGLGRVGVPWCYGLAGVRVFCLA